LKDNNKNLNRIISFFTTEQSRIKSFFDFKSSRLVISNLKINSQKLIENGIIKDNLNKFFNENHSLEISRSIKKTTNKRSCGSIFFYEGLRDEDIIEPKITVIIEVTSIQFLLIGNAIKNNISDFLSNFIIDIHMSPSDFDYYKVSDRYSDNNKIIKILDYKIKNIIS
jgi:hypothetical protein